MNKCINFPVDLLLIDIWNRDGHGKVEQSAIITAEIRLGPASRSSYSADSEAGSAQRIPRDKKSIDTRHRWQYIRAEEG